MQGQKIDIRHHLERFSSEAAILTTGGRTTHVQRHAIVLGPHPITPHVLAHEFGHILGFRDRYVRGYENLGEHGFRVMEVVADDSDVMAATGYGTVGRRHFVELRHRARAGSQLHENPKSQRITISTSVRRISIESAHRDPPYALQLPLLLMIMPARRGDDGDDHNREHTESNQQSDRGIHTQDLSAGRSGWSLRSRLARLPGGSSRPRSAFPSFTFGPCAILSVSTLNADIDAPIAHLSFYRPFPFILPWSVLGARDSSESKRDNEQKCA
jgi:hypothetical protein